MRKIRIEDGSVDLYLKLLKMIEREGINYEERNRRCLTRTNGGNYAFGNHTHSSLDGALQAIKRVYGIKTWYVVEKDGTIPTRLREVEDEILTVLD